MIERKLTSVEICAGGGGQALGLEWAGFEHLALVEIDKHACETLRTNRPAWNVLEADLTRFDGRPYRGVDLLAGGVPCSPFTHAGKKLGRLDERDLLPEFLRLVEEIQPRAVMLENVRGLLGTEFADYRQEIDQRLSDLGYHTEWKLLNAMNYGVPQSRPRVVMVALPVDAWAAFCWPTPEGQNSGVGEVLLPLLGSLGWKQADAWAQGAQGAAPTIVGGSKKHGGPDLGPTRAKRAWAALGVDGHGVANSAPAPDFEGMPKLTVEMVARLQGFPAEWQFAGRKTNAYRQVGNAFPPPVAAAVGQQLGIAIRFQLDSEAASFANLRVGAV